jgi:hypothetical protein
MLLAYAWLTARNERTSRRSLFLGDGILDRRGDFCDQGCFSGGAEIQDGAHLVSKHSFRRFYRLDSTGDGGPQSAALFHKGCCLRGLYGRDYK